jgi:hypothetical protein
MNDLKLRGKIESIKYIDEMNAIITLKTKKDNGGIFATMQSLPVTVTSSKIDELHKLKIGDTIFIVGRVIAKDETTCITIADKIYYKDDYIVTEY